MSLYIYTYIDSSQIHICICDEYAYMPTRICAVMYPYALLYGGLIYAFSAEIKSSRASHQEYLTTVEQKMR